MYPIASYTLVPQLVSTHATSANKSEKKRGLMTIYCGKLSRY